MKNWFIYMVVFISGASVLGIEILGTRILGPFYGVNLFLWSALISVTLIALSMGYLIGGRWADKGPKLTHICYLLIGSGTWLLLLPWIKYPLLSLSEPLGLRGAVLTAAFVLFTPPLTLLGMISPYAIRLRTSSLGKVGQTAGDLYAISTIGSVLSALVTGFFLIPNVGIGSLILMIGGILLLTAFIGLVLIKKSPTHLAISSVLLLIACGTIGFNSLDQAGQVSGLNTIEQSPYAELRVLDKDGKRYLLIDGGTHTIVNPETWESLFPYTAVLDLSKEFFEKPGQMLLVGLGGGSVMKNFAKEGWKVSAVEIDPGVIKLAKSHFGLLESEGKTFCEDGRQFLLVDDQKYNVVVMDAFGSSSIPFHLVTKESFSLIHDHLKPGGILAINVESSSWKDKVILSLVASLKNSFSHVQVLPTHDRELGLGNMIIFASQNELIRTKEISQWDIPSKEYLNSLEYVKDYAWSNRFEPNTENVQVLTDELNPIELWAEEINLKARQELHNYFDQEGSSW